MTEEIKIETNETINAPVTQASVEVITEAAAEPAAETITEKAVEASVEKAAEQVIDIVADSVVDIINEIKFNLVEKSIDFHGSKLTLQNGEMARLADGAVVCKYGETVVLCSVVYDKSAAPKNDFFPLMVLYQEKYYAANRIPGGFLKREARPNDYEVLNSRIIDRTIRPMFDEKFINEIQVICTVISYDGTHSPIFAAMTATCAALKISGAPLLKTVAGVGVGFDGTNFVANAKSGSMLDLFVAGTDDSIMMVESQAQELTEDKIIEAIAFAHEQVKTVCTFIDDFTSVTNNKPKFKVEQGEDLSAYKTKIETQFGEQIAAIFKIKDKTIRGGKIEEIKQQVISHIINVDATIDDAKQSKIIALFKDVQKDAMRKQIIKEGVRIDGRKADQIRPISIRTGVLPGLHGSALFTRGETQALVITTIGGEKEAQMIETLEGMTKLPFMLNYNFPAYSVNELGRYSGPGRREIGHGNLAHRALEPVLPNKRSMPYSIRVVSEILESNGSSSMATVCGGCLSIANAGVPLLRPVSGIAMGLIKEGDDVVILSDILGDEDSLGDMDFKVAGTEKGITALQMDIKIMGVTIETLTKAVAQAKHGRAYILARMLPYLPSQSQGIEDENESEGDLHNDTQFANEVSETIKIDPARIREIIGQGGSVVNLISEKSNCNIDIAQDGSVKITSIANENISQAKQMIDNILVKLEVGSIVEVVVSRVVDSYAIVTTDSGKSGMLHITEVCHSNLDNIAIALIEGEKVKVKVLESEGGRAKFSIKNIDQITGKEFKIENGNIVYL